MLNQDNSAQLRQQVKAAYDSNCPLKIVGNESKAYLGRDVSGEVLSCSAHSGIIEYEPSELVITARAGTLLSELQRLLDKKDQMLGFEPPVFDDKASLGGAVATSLAGPRRLSNGSVRDSVLGVSGINGRGEVLKFGGKVVKNVAGYDVSRLLAGSFGTLMVMTDISLRVFPKPKHEHYLYFPIRSEQAIIEMNRLMSNPWPISGLSYYAGHILLRASGDSGLGDYMSQQLPQASLHDEGEQWWQGITQMSSDFFIQAKNLYRISIKSTSAPINLSGEWLIDWAGSQRWLSTQLNEAQVRHTVSQLGGHVTVHKASESILNPFEPLPKALAELHYRLKIAFDPEQVLNPGKMYQGI